MPVSWSRTYVRRVYPTDAQIEARVLDVAARFAKVAVVEVKKTIWNYSRFVYRNIRPRPSSSKSEAAWLGWAERIRSGETVIVLQNPAKDRRGTNYPKFVHLAGRSKSDRLMEEVRDYMDEEIAPRLAAAVALAVEDELTRAGMRTITVRAG